MKRFFDNFFTNVFVSFILTVTIVVTQCAIGNAQNVQPVDKQVEKSVLTERWEEVADLLVSVNPQTSSPVLRLIMGHATLSLNRNNESLCLFLSTSSEEDLKEWEKWTQNFVKKNPKNAISHYFRGDALARLEQWDEALESFNIALKFHPNHPMVLNARGTTYSAKGKWDDALVDFTKATIANKSLADAYASLGAMWIQKRAGAEGALKSFNHALKFSPDFALAFNGKGCVEYALGHWEEANEDIGKAGKFFNLNCQKMILPIVNRNLSILSIAAKRAQFPFFSTDDFVNWSSIKTILQDPRSILYSYFIGIELPEDVDNLIVSKFNELLEIPRFYDEHKDKIDTSKASRDSNAGINELITLIMETESLRKKSFGDMTGAEKDKIRKLNRLILEFLFPKDIIQIAMNLIDSPGFSLERGILEFGGQYLHKRYDPPEVLKGGIRRMQNWYKPLAGLTASIPYGSGLSNIWNSHLDNQIALNKHLLGWDKRPISPSGGVDFNMRKKAHIDEGNWGIGTWFGLAYHVETVNPAFVKKEKTK